MKYQISIPSPCGENWDEMSPTAKGRYCGACETEVIDFTTKTDKEILDFIQSGAKACGNYKKSQLAHTYVVPKSTYFWQRYLRTGLTIGLGFLSVVGFAQAQNESVVVEQNKDLNNDRISQPSGSDSLIVKGVVRDSQQRPLVGVTIIEVGTNNMATTDESGKFEIEVSSFSSKLDISYLGYEGRQIALSRNTEFLEIVLKEYLELGAVTLRGVVAYHKEVEPVPVKNKRRRKWLFFWRKK